MKKLLLVGVVGLSALLGGCGGSSDCDEEVLPPVTEAQFPNGQEPEYVIRQHADITGRNVTTYGQLLSMEVLEGDRANVVIQKFEADYSNGYATKPTDTVVEGKAELRVKIGGYQANLTSYDLNKLKSSLMTVSFRGNNAADEMIVYVTLPVLGELQELNGNSVRVDGIDYPLGTVDMEDGLHDAYIGRHVAGMFDGDKLNIISLSVATPTWGNLIPVKVGAVYGQSDLSYLDSDGNEVTVFLNTRPTMDASDRVVDAAVELRDGDTILIQANKFDGVTASSANVYKVSSK